MARSSRRTTDAPFDPRPRNGAFAAAARGVHPAHQMRSRAKQDALITSGIRMLEERDYKSLSIADLTAANGVSIGAFYARFSGKDAFFNALQAHVLADASSDASTHLAPHAWQDQPPHAVVEAFVAFFIDLVRRYRGVIFAALQQEASHATAWTPIRDAGAAIAAPFITTVVPKLTHLPPAQRAARAEFAVQVLYGTLINAVLHDPGPIALNDNRLAKELQRLLCAYLGLSEMPDAGKAKKTARRRTKSTNGLG